MRAEKAFLIEPIGRNTGPAVTLGRGDIGSRNTVSGLVRPDETGNRVVGEAVLVDAGNTYVRSENRVVPAGQRHRLENPGNVDLVLIEVRSGEYLGANDIMRFEDVYRRAYIGKS